MDKIILKLKEIVLGYLLEDNNKYVFIAEENNIKLAYKKYPLFMRLYNLNENGKKFYDFLPYPFSELREALSRQDIVIKAKINNDDSEFQKLYKAVGLNIELPNFSIIQG